MYYWPKLEKYKFSRQEVHRVNLFGDKTDIKKRLMYILQINQSVFEDNSYGYYLETLISENKNAYTKDIHVYQESIKTLFENELYANNQLFDESITDHHIIFQNKYNNWHPSHQDNLVPLDRWRHTSFHELQKQEMLFPHQQFTRLLKLEKDLVKQELWKWLIALENEFDHIFKVTPYELYKKQCFRN